MVWLATLVLAAAVASAIFVVRSAKEAGGLGLEGVLTLVLCFAPTLTIIVAAVGGGRTLAADGQGGVTYIASEDWSVSTAAKTVALGLALAVAVNGLLRGRIHHPSALLASVAAVVALLAGALQGFPLIDGRTAPMVLIFLAFAFIKSGSQVNLGVSLFAVTVVAGSAVLWLASPASATLPCAPYKCGPTGVLLVGVLNNENQLAIPLALALPFLLRQTHGWPRVFVAATMCGFIFLTGSRTSAIAAAAYLAFLVVVSMIGSGPARRILAGLSAAAALAAALIVPLSTSNTTAFTGRGLLWEEALAVWQDSPLVGVGVEYWTGLITTGQIPPNAGSTPSNLWVDTLMVAGLIGLALLIVAVSIRCLSLPKLERTFLFSVGVLVGVLGIAESPMVFADISSPSAFFLPAILCSAIAPDTSSARVGLRRGRARSRMPLVAQS